MSAGATTGAPRRSWRDDLSAQAVATGLSSTAIGYSGSVAVVVAGLAAAGATAGQVATGLAAACVLLGVGSVVASARWRLPVAVVWSTPGAAVLVAVGPLEGGFALTVGALLVTAALVALTGAVRPLAAAVARFPPALSAAVLAGVLLPFCARAVTGVAALPLAAGAIALVWLVALRLAPAWSAPAALAALVAVVLLGGAGSGGAGPVPAGGRLPALELVRPALSAEAVVRLVLPLYLVTMSAQNLVGLAVLSGQGYRPPVRALLGGTGALSAVGALLGAPTVNLAAITGALTAGPSAHPDPARRWVATATAGAGYLALAPLAGAAAALVTGVDPRLVGTAAGLALVGALSGAAAGAVREEATRVPAVLTLLVTASGITAAPAIGLAVGLLAAAAVHRPRQRPPAA